MMRKIILTEWVSIDGFTSGPNDDAGTEHAAVRGGGSPLVGKLKHEDGKDILIYGSGSIVQQLTNLGLIDEYQILVLPTILGGGKPLFKDIKAKRTLKLVNVKAFNSGVVVMTYQL